MARRISEPDKSETPPPPKRRRGFVCSRCLVPLRVAYTRMVASDTIRRCRECPECGGMVITEERPRTVPN